MPDCVDLHLDGNEGARPDPRLLAGLADHDPELLRRYPQAADLQGELAARLGVTTDQVLVLAGGDEVLDRCFRAWTEPGRNAVWPEPSFEMLIRYAEIAGCTVRNPDWHEGPFPVDAVLDACDERTALVIVVSPNNPSGATATAADFERLCTALPQALIVLDHAYVEFADDDLTTVALRHRNALVVRTLSKAWGLAGLRVGYALGDADVLAILRAAGGPYSVAATSLHLARHALHGDDAFAAFVVRVRDERVALTAQLRGHGLHVPDSQGNFVLARGARAPWLGDALRGLGIAVRSFAERPGLEDALRITCPGNSDDQRRLTAGIDAALSAEAVCLHSAMVLPRSDREAITARLPVVALPDRPACAWLLGDHPSHFTAARAAGVVPIGVADSPARRDALLAAGAARVLAEPTDLLELMP